MLFLRQLGWELFRLFARRRTYIGFGVFLAVEMLFYWLWTRERSQEGMERFIERIAGGFDEYFSALTLGFLIVTFTMLLLGVVLFRSSRETSSRRKRRTEICGYFSCVRFRDSGCSW
jgi:ABC-2 type transport system permease protein